MKKLCWLAASVVVATVAMISGNERSAEARPNYWETFEGKYVKAADANPKFAEEATAAKCGVCHEGKDKKNRNSYGKEIAKLITPKEKDKAKIEATLDKVAAEPSAPGGPTFGDLIKEGKLPGK